jgi:phosphoglycolate phosphatase
MLQVALASHSSDLSFEQCRRRFLEIYSANLAQYTSLFPGMEGVLTHLETHGILWGVVTNKPSYLTLPLMKQLNLHERSHITVSGDTTSESKPHPLPLIHACQQIGVECAHTLYIGDAQRDIEAGKAAGMTTLIALYGYLGPDDTPQEWGADGCISHPLEILSWIK